MNRILRRLSAVQTLAIGFALLILLGALLLTIPFCSRNGQSIPFFDALFTAASATCVTGLVVYDTWTQFTFFGQLIILLLIQIGGLGFMMMSVLAAMILGRKIGLKERMLLMEAFSSPQLTGIVRLSRRALLGTLLIEGMGAALLSIRFIPDFGPITGLWYSIFHSISAFCNAGFDLLGCFEPYGSLVPYQGDWLVCLTVISLIVLGGLGFMVWEDILLKKRNFSQYRLHTKLMLTATLILVLGGTVLFFFSEKNASMQNMDVSDRVLASLFQAVTTRTAGFNTIDQAQLSDLGGSASMLLMFIGAGAGSTGGGVKISTFSVLLLSVWAYVRGQDDLTLFGRRIEKDMERRAFNGATLYLLILFLGHTVVVTAEQLPLFDTLFECVSAVGTVGISTGITRSLSAISRFTLILMMFAGRVGSLSIAMAFTERRNAPTRLPAEKIIVG